MNTFITNDRTTQTPCPRLVSGHGFRGVQVKEGVDGRDEPWDEPGHDGAQPAARP